MTGLASSDFARHYSRNHCCFLFLRVLRCFTSPRSLYPPYIFRRESPGTHAPWRGFPIRRPSDHSSIISSPRLIADFYVLLRLQMPRHPPFALKNLTTKNHATTTSEEERHDAVNQCYLVTPTDTLLGKKLHSNPLTLPQRRKLMSSRCSRPLCSSQKTGGPRIVRQQKAIEPGPSEEFNHPPAFLPTDRFGPSGPNNVHAPTTRPRNRSRLQRSRTKHEALV